MSDDNVISILNAKKLRPVMRAIIATDDDFITIEEHQLITHESIKKVLTGGYDFLLEKDYEDEGA